MLRRRCDAFAPASVQTRDAIQKTLKQILRSRNAEAGEDYVTLRNERFVIPVRAENRRSVPGVVHGASATGQTIFLEPLETVETEQPAGAACGRRSGGDSAHSAGIDRAVASGVRVAGGCGGNDCAARWRFCTRAICAGLRCRHAGIF